jgi:hypothetical protein
MSRKEKAVEVTYLLEGEATVTTKDLYRVVYHGPDVNKDIYPDEEFLTAEEAIQSAEIHNSLELYVHGDDIRRCPTFAEVLSYKETEKRWDTRERDEDIEERVKDRLETIEDERKATAERQPNHGVVRRLLTRAAAMIW